MEIWFIIILRNTNQKKLVHMRLNKYELPQLNSTIIVNVNGISLTGIVANIIYDYVAKEINFIIFEK